MEAGAEAAPEVAAAAEPGAEAAGEGSPDREAPAAKAPAGSKKVRSAQLALEALQTKREKNEEQMRKALQRAAGKTLPKREMLNVERWKAAASAAAFTAFCSQYSSDGDDDDDGGGGGSR